MEGKPLRALIGGIQKFSIEDGPGIRTTVFLKGCPLRCKWCHNPELIDFNQEVMRMPSRCIGCGYCVKTCSKEAIYLTDDRGIDIHRERCDRCMKCTEICYARALQPVAKFMTVDEILKEVEQDKDFYKHTDGGLTISGGEVLSHPGFAGALIDESAKRNIGVCLDTSGYGDGEWMETLSLKENVTHILFDMKAIDNDVHHEYTGQSNSLILENLERLARNKDILPKLMMRMPLIRDVNDSMPIIEKTAEYYKEYKVKKVTLLPYHNLGISKERNIGRCQTEFHPPEKEKVEEIKRYFTLKAGMEIEILGTSTHG